MGFVLHRAYKETGDEKYRKSAVRCRDLIHAAARPAGKGVDWGKYTDIIAGASGTGLYLLEHARTMNDPASRELAARATQSMPWVARAYSPPPPGSSVSTVILCRMPLVSKRRTV